MKLPVYIDYHATTPVDPLVVEAMLPYFTEKFGNPASRQHRFGWIAEESVETARGTIAASFGAEPRDIIFTSGATESNNLALKGIADAWKHKGNRIITVQTEHKSVIDSAKKLEKLGCQVTYLPVDEFGSVDLDHVRDAITPETIVVSVMTANNEIGTTQNISEIARLCHEKGTLFHTDATQAVGKIPLDVKKMGIDLLSFSGHKIYGPKGIGVLYVRHGQPKVKLTMQMDGGGHERGIRSGTLNVPSIIGLAKAVEISITSMEEETKRLGTLRDKMFNEFTGRLADVILNGHPINRLPNNLNLSFLGVEDNALIMSMKDIAVSTGSACSTSNPEPSHVLRALRLPHERLHSALRFGLGRYTTEEEVQYVIDRVIDHVQKLRNLSPSYARLRRQDRKEMKGRGDERN